MQFHRNALPASGVQSCFGIPSCGGQCLRSVHRRRSQGGPHTPSQWSPGIRGIGSHALRLLHNGVRRWVRIRSQRAMPPRGRRAETPCALRVHTRLTARLLIRQPRRLFFMHTGGRIQVGGSTVRDLFHRERAAMASTGSVGAPSNILCVTDCVDAPGVKIGQQNQGVRWSFRGCTRHRQQEMSRRAPKRVGRKIDLS